LDGFTRNLKGFQISLKSRNRFSIKKGFVRRLFFSVGVYDEALEPVLVVEKVGTWITSSSVNQLVDIEFIFYLCSMGGNR
jgi:hypothetical protein